MKNSKILNPQDTRDTHETPQQHDARHSNLLLDRHLQLEDLRDGDHDNNNVVEHIDDTKGQEELLDLDAASAERIGVGPVVGYGLAGVGHGDGDDDGVGDGEEEADVEGDAEEQVAGDEDAALEEEDRDLGRGAGAGEGVDAAVAVHDLEGLSWVRWVVDGR